MVAVVENIQTFPTANQVAAAVVAACRLTMDDPVELMGQRRHFHGRYLALSAMREAFPRMRAVDLARLLNFGDPERATVALSSIQRSSWWNEEWVDEVVGALVHDRYGARGQ